MNIFLPYANTDACARVLDDKRLIKMILETAQILCTAYSLADWSTIPLDNAYKATHTKHPCVLWAALTPQNWAYLVRYFNALHKEYNYRFGREHKSWLLLYKNFCAIKNTLLFRSAITPFVNCTRGATKGNAYDFRHLEVHRAYQCTLHHKWLYDSPSPKWTKRDVPQFSSINKSHHPKATLLMRA